MKTSIASSFKGNGGERGLMSTEYPGPSLRLFLASRKTSGTRIPTEMHINENGIVNTCAIKSKQLIKVVILRWFVNNFGVLFSLWGY